MAIRINRRIFIKKLRAALIASSCVSVLKAFDHTRDDECPGGASECDDCNPVVSGSDECTLAEGGDSPPPDCTSLNMDYVE